MKTTPRVRLRYFAVLILPAVVLGCKGRVAENPAHKLRKEADEDSSNTFAVDALKTLETLDQHNPTKARERVIDGLNRWLERTGLADDWRRDPLVDQLPRRWIDRYKPIRELGSSRFVLTDAFYLQECVFARDIAKFVTNPSRSRDQALNRYHRQARSASDDESGGGSQDSADQLADAMQRLHPFLDKSGAHDLAAALRLFDWTVRNIQLDELLPPPKVDAVTVAPGEKLNEEEEMRRLFPQNFHPGPGYRRLPLEVLMNGQADAWERARLFILLARQAGIDVVMLALQHEELTTPPEPWLPAAFIQGRLFLFDTELGFPIDGPKGRGIATLNDVLADRQLLRSLDIMEDGKIQPYRITEQDQSDIASDKKLVVAMIDAPVTALAQRTELLEDQLTSDQKMVLTVRPSQPRQGQATSLEQDLRRCKGIGQVRLWTVPFGAAIYAQGIVYRLQKDPKLMKEFERKQDMFSIASFTLSERRFPLAEARFQHFRGRFAGAEGTADRGALSLYVEARQPHVLVRKNENKAIIEKVFTPEAIASDEVVQRAFGLDKEKDAATKQQKILDAQQRLQRSTAAAAYWLALAHFDNGSYSSAAKWLKRQLDAGRLGAWTAGTRYNLARAYEALGDTETARALYLADDSPQRHGNHLRARALAPTPSPAPPPR